MTEKEEKAIEIIINRIDERRKILKEEYKKSPQYRSAKKYKSSHQYHLDTLLERRNTLVSVLNYCYTQDIRNLEELL